jgi:hypothetical protein
MAKANVFVNKFNQKMAAVDACVSVRVTYLFDLKAYWSRDASTV